MTQYVLDANVFIEAHRRYYSFSFCPGYWDFIKLQFNQQESTSIVKVYNEIVRNVDALSSWVKTELSRGDFIGTADDASIAQEYTRVSSWVLSSSQYMQHAKENFLATDAADPWLCAFAVVRGATVVTVETAAPQSKSRVKLPDVLDAFGVPYIGVADYLDHQRARFVLSLD